MLAAATAGGAVWNRAKDDTALMGRKWDGKGEVLVEADEGMCAGDTQVLRGPREPVLPSAPPSRWAHDRTNRRTNRISSLTA
jgi:hypothetical protein